MAIGIDNLINASYRIRKQPKAALNHASNYSYSITRANYSLKVSSWEILFLMEIEKGRCQSL